MHIYVRLINPFVYIWPYFDVYSSSFLCHVDCSVPTFHLQPVQCVSADASVVSWCWLNFAAGSIPSNVVTDGRPSTPRRTNLLPSLVWYSPSPATVPLTACTLCEYSVLQYYYSPDDRPSSSVLVIFKQFLMFLNLFWVGALKSVSL